MDDKTVHTVEGKANQPRKNRKVQELKHNYTMKFVIYFL